MSNAPPTPGPCLHGFPPGTHERLVDQLAEWDQRDSRVACLFCRALVDLRPWCQAETVPPAPCEAPPAKALPAAKAERGQA